ncbi:isochorismatase family protein [Pseudomonas sp. N3-W]|uniref:isochorismatase family protein n=1 Tax=Pseudomonas sp. N3-W TaxID=2975049 RepID=UPI00217D8C4F|nr:isochorismatase family protein [Pseudomonas sp. N3-W]UWF51472.1 isochorismatase family protein [Pseudomonas sp. N3-W]
MAITALDPNTALIVVDLQKGIVGYPFIHPIEAIVERSRALLDAFRQRGLPVVLVNVTGFAPGRTERPRRSEALPEDWAELIPELDQQPGDLLVTKRSWGAFANTDLEQRLKALGVTQVVVTGVATGTGVESTARQAYEHGFNVTLSVDAMTDANPEAHAYSVNHVFPRLGETGTAQDIINRLDTTGA